MELKTDNIPAFLLVYVCVVHDQMYWCTYIYVYVQVEASSWYPASSPIVFCVIGQVWSLTWTLNSWYSLLSHLLQGSPVSTSLLLWLPFDLHNHLPWIPGVWTLVFILVKQILYLLSHLLSTPSWSLAVRRSQDGLRNAQQLHKAARDAFVTEGIWWTQQGQENL